MLTVGRSQQTHQCGIRPPPCESGPLFTLLRPTWDQPTCGEECHREVGSDSTSVWKSINQSRWPRVTWQVREQTLTPLLFSSPSSGVSVSLSLLLCLISSGSYLTSHKKKISSFSSPMLFSMSGLRPEQTNWRNCWFICVLLPLCTLIHTRIKVSNVQSEPGLSHHSHL